MQNPRRRTVVLVLTVLLPAAALVAIALRLFDQERELADRRLAQARRTLIAQVGHDLLAHIDRIAPDTPLDSIVVLAARVENTTFSLPWERPADEISAPLRQLLFEAGRLEYQRQFTEAESRYRRAASLAGTDSERALTTLSLARNADQRGDVVQARTLYAQLARVPLHIGDDEGMPFALYAAGRLQARMAAPQDIPLSPVALYALRQHLTGSDSLRIEERIKDAEQLRALRRDYPALRTNAAQHADRVWSAYGSPVWLVRADSTRVVALRSAPLLAGVNVALHRNPIAGAEPLGAAFPGLYATLPNPNINEPASLSLTLLLILVLLTLGLGSVTAYIAWRDVRREVRAAALRTQFVSSVSHELKTPLTAIRMYAELLNMRADIGPAKREEYLTTIVHESERLTRLINNVLDFSRIERGERSYHREPISLEDFAADVQRSMSYPLTQAGFDMEVSVDPDLAPVRADYDALAQAVLNLLSNAMKFSEHERRIELRVARRNGHAIIAVKDRGRGISAAARPHIFEEFYRAPEVDAAGIPGTGLGLALVAHVARGHGGEVQVESEPGQGSTFTIHLPMDE